MSYFTHFPKHDIVSSAKGKEETDHFDFSSIKAMLNDIEKKTNNSISNNKSLSNDANSNVILTFNPLFDQVSSILNFILHDFYDIFANDYIDKLYIYSNRII